MRPLSIPVLLVAIALGAAGAVALIVALFALAEWSSGGAVEAGQALRFWAGASMLAVPAALLIGAPLAARRLREARDTRSWAVNGALAGLGAGVLLYALLRLGTGLAAFLGEVSLPGAIGLLAIATSGGSVAALLARRIAFALSRG